MEDKNFVYLLVIEFQSFEWVLFSGCLYVNVLMIKILVYMCLTLTVPICNGGSIIDPKKLNSGVKSQLL